MKSTINQAVTALCLTLFLIACQKPTPTPDTQSPAAADKLFTNGKIYTMASPEWADVLAISGEKIVYVGNAEGAQRFLGDSTEVIDLEGRFVMPGINDAHLHTLEGTNKTLFQCNFPFTATPEEIQQAVASCAQNTDADWVIGGQWDSSFFVNHPLESPRSFLDEVSQDKAVFLSADSGHDGWVNSKALALLGITAASENPEGGTIVRDSQGEPNGVLLEKAYYKAYGQVPTWTREQYLKGAQRLMEIANGYGVTGMKDASAEEADIRALHDLAQQQGLSAHMATSINFHKSDAAEGFHVDRFVELRDRYRYKDLDTRYVKLFMDGVPTASRTAAMLADYLPAQPGHASHSGELHFSEEQLKTMLAVLDAAGFTVKIHTAGDRAVQVTLNAIEHTRQANGNKELRHELAHAGYIDESDIPRFKSLNAVADLSPYIWHPSPIMDSVIGAVGNPRAERYWPMRDLVDAQAPILAGSDWPAAVASMNPWIGLEAMVTRADPEGVSPGTLWPEQAITVAEALRIFTMDGAKALRLSEQTGSLELGKLANFIVLNHNLFDVPAEAISDTEVMTTYFRGKQVHSATP